MGDAGGLVDKIAFAETKYNDVDSKQTGDCDLLLLHNI